MIIAVGIILFLCLIMSLLAGRKGYSPGCWFLAFGFIGLIVLAFLPFVNDKGSLPEDDRAAKKRTGDIIGGAISGFAVLLLVVRIGALS